MKNITVTALFLLLSTNAFACYDDKSLSIEDTVDNCLVEAEQGVAVTQHFTGIAYEYGIGSAQDHKSAHMWFNIAAANGYSGAVENRDIVAKKMTPSQIEKAQDMAREWMAKH